MNSRDFEIYVRLNFLILKIWHSIKDDKVKCYRINNKIIDCEEKFNITENIGYNC